MLTLLARLHRFLGLRAPHWYDGPQLAMAYRKRLTPNQRTTLRRERRQRVKIRQSYPAISADHVKKIDKALESEFAKADWKIVESEKFL